MPKIITGYTGTPHVTSDDAAAFQQGIVGYDDYALASENQLTAVTVESSGSHLRRSNSRHNAPRQNCTAIHQRRLYKC